MPVLSLSSDSSANKSRNSSFVSTPQSAHRWGDAVRRAMASCRGLNVPVRDRARANSTVGPVVRSIPRLDMASFSLMDDSVGFGEAEARITPRLIDSFYTEAMVLADEARSYFDDSGHEDRRRLDAFTRVSFACESLKVTTRIMHIVAWLLTQRAIESGEIHYAEGRRPERRLGNAQVSDPNAVAKLPEPAQRLISASADLYARVKRLDDGNVVDEPAQSPARALMGRLERGLTGGA